MDEGWLGRTSRYNGRGLVGARRVNLAGRTVESDNSTHTLAPGELQYKRFKKNTNISIVGGK